MNVTEGYELWLKNYQHPIGEGFVWMCVLEYLVFVFGVLAISYAFYKARFYL